MSTHTNTESIVVLDTPEQIDAYLILSIRSALKLEVNTGMRFSRRVNVLKQAQALGLTKAKTKAKALEDLNAICAQILGE